MTISQRDEEILIESIIKYTFQSATAKKRKSKVQVTWAILQRLRLSEKKKKIKKSVSIQYEFFLIKDSLGFHRRLLQQI